MGNVWFSFVFRWGGWVWFGFGFIIMIIYIGVTIGKVAIEPLFSDGIMGILGKTKADFKTKAKCMIRPW